MSDTPSCWTREDRKARKPHKCCECRGTIQVGETYQYFSGVWDEPATYKTCKDCAELRSLVDTDIPYDEVTPFGLLHETVFNRELVPEIRRYIDIKRQRGADVPEWMESRLLRLATP